MTLLGSGFLARHLGAVADAHPDAVILAQGVSRTVGEPESAYRREAEVLYDVIRRCRREGRLLVFLSTASAAMYGAADCRGEEDGAVFPLTPYGRHKLSLEAVVRASGVRFLVLRLSHVVGPHQPAHQLLPSLVRATRSGSVEVYRGAVRDLISVFDVATIVSCLLTAGVEGQVVNVASGYAVPVTRIVDLLELKLGPVRRHYRDVPGDCSVSLDRLRRLVPAVTSLGFGPDYYRGVIERYLESA